jgi:type I restriction enzyme S subunit
MGARYRAYSEYKESEIDWFQDIPVKWIRARLKFMASINMGQAPSSNDCNQEGFGIPFLQGNAEFGIKWPTAVYYCRIPKKIAKRGDFLFSVRAPVGALNIADQIYGIGRGLCSIRPSYELSSSYLWWLIPVLKTELDSVSTGSTFEAVSSEQVRNVELYLPESISDQETISNFLDHETAKIDTLIEKQQQLIALLKEKRQAVISHAVTKGLNPNAPMKDSGVEWLGEVPAHWVVSRFKYHTKLFEQGWSPQCDSREASSDEYGVLKVGCVNNGIFSHNENKALPKDLKPRTQYIIRKFDLLISRANTRELVGSAAVVDRDYSRLILCDKLYRVRFQDTTNTQLIAYFLALPVVRQQIELGATGASHSMQNIGQSSIKELHILLPPLQEAESLIAGIKKKIAIFEQVMNKATDQISLLQERRTALISAAVTGKIDVRNWQPPTDTKNIPDSL